MIRMGMAIVALMLIGYSFAGFATAQSIQEGIRLNREGAGLRKSAQSHEDLLRALGRYQKALKIFERHNHKNGIAAVNNNLGMVYKDLGQYDRAKEYFEKSLDISREEKDKQKVEGTLNNLGLVHRRMGQYDKAVKCYEESLAMTLEEQDQPGQGSTLHNLGVVYEK